MGMAKYDRDGGDNRRMTGNVNIYICSEALEKGKKSVETDGESAVSNVTEKPKVTINPSAFGSNRANRKIEQSTSSNAAANNRDKLIMATEFNESRGEAKSRSNDSKAPRGDEDEKRKIPGVVSCRCPRYDESDLWLENAKNKRSQRRAAVALGNEGERSAKEAMDLKKDDENPQPVEQGKKFGPSKRKSKVKLKKEKRKVREAKENNTWFSYFRRKADSSAKGDAISDDEDLCTCEKIFAERKNKRGDFEKRSKDKIDKRGISTKKTRKINVEGEAESKKKNHNDANESKIPNRIDRSSSPQKKNVELASPKKHDHKKRPLSGEKSPNKKLPKSISFENQNNSPDKKSSLKKDEPEKNAIIKKGEKNMSSNEMSPEYNKKKDKSKLSVQRVKLNNKSHEQKDLSKFKSDTEEKSLKDKKNEEETSFFAKFFNLFKSNREVPRKESDKTRNKCDESCSELKKTAKTSSSVRRKSKGKRRRHKSELAGKIKEPKITEKAFSSSNRSNIQVNERKDQVSPKSGPRLANKMNNTEVVANREKTRRNVDSPEEKSNMKGNLKKTINEDHKPNSTQTEHNLKVSTNEENSLRLCFSCLFPSGNCLCRSKFPEQQSCDCKKIVTFCCDELCRPSNDKKLHGSEVLPYQRLRSFPKVVNEMQGKMSENVNNDERCTCTDEECCDDKKPRAKCYYCKNLPCRCCVIGAPRRTSKQ